VGEVGEVRVLATEIECRRRIEVGEMMVQDLGNEELGLMHC
jgi:hypothetical protein